MSGTSVKEPKGVRLDHISKIYKNPKTGKDFYAVHDVELDIAPGSFVTLLGPSGCGKTTTLRMIAGFESPDEGEIYLGGEPINELTPNKRDTAMVFQSYALFPHYNVFDNVAYGLKLRKVPSAEIKERVTRILKLVELSDMEQRMTNQLSGGQQQRVALARALVVEPGVLLFDEPLSNLDAKLRESMRFEIKEIQRSLGMTVVYVTHDQTEAMAMSDRIILINQGKIQQVGTPAEIYNHPINPFVADFLGKVDFFRGIAESGTVRLDGGTFSLPYDGEKRGTVVVAVRPERITLSTQAGELQGEFLADLLDLDHSRDAVYRVEFICGSRASDQESEPDGQGTDSREEGGQICAGALEFLQPYMDEGLLTSLAADPERMQDLPELECFLSLPELKKRYAGEPVLPDFILCADGQTALDTADWARERYQGRKPPLITAVGLDAELAGALRSGDVTMTAFCPWKYEAAAAVDLTLALLSGEMISQDWVEHAGFPFECCLGNRFGSGDLQNDTLLLRPETVTGNNLEKILYLYKEDEPQTDPGF